MAIPIFLGSRDVMVPIENCCVGHHVGFQDGCRLIKDGRRLRNLFSFKSIAVGGLAPKSREGCSHFLNNTKVSTMLEYHKTIILRSGGIRNSHRYGGHLGFQNGRHWLSIFLHISQTKRDRNKIPAATPTFWGSRKTMTSIWKSCARRHIGFQDGRR